MTIWQPQHEVEIVAGTPPGGGQDRPARTLIRILAEQELIEVPMKVSNIVGKGGGAAWDYLLEHPGDPHVLAINSPPLLTNRLFGVSDYHHAELTPVVNLYTEYVAFVVRQNSKIADATDLKKRLGSDPGGTIISLATALGTTNHIAAAQIARQAGGDVARLAIRVFDSARFAVADVVAGNAEVAAVSAVSAAPEITEGKLRPIAVTGPDRLPGIFAAAPTLAEIGIDCVMGTWRGVLAPHGVGRAQVAFWENAFAAATRSAEWHRELAGQFWVNAFMNASECTAFLDAELASLTLAIKQLKLMQ
jgi:putative tricarboxylic transport membrane protein